MSDFDVEETQSRTPVLDISDEGSLHLHDDTFRSHQEAAALAQYQGFAIKKLWFSLNHMENTDFAAGICKFLRHYSHLESLFVRPVGRWDPPLLEPTGLATVACWQQITDALIQAILDNPSERLGHRSKLRSVRVLGFGREDEERVEPTILLPDGSQSCITLYTPRNSPLMPFFMNSISSMKVLKLEVHAASDRFLLPLKELILNAKYLTELDICGCYSDRSSTDITPLLPTLLSNTSITKLSFLDVMLSGVVSSDELPENNTVSWLWCNRFTYGNIDTDILAWFRFRGLRRIHHNPDIISPLLLLHRSKHPLPLLTTLNTTYSSMDVDEMRSLCTLLASDDITIEDLHIGGSPFLGTSITKQALLTFFQRLHHFRGLKKARVEHKIQTVEEAQAIVAALKKVRNIPLTGLQFVEKTDNYCPRYEELRDAILFYGHFNDRCRRLHKKYPIPPGLWPLILAHTEENAPLLYNVSMKFCLFHDFLVNCADKDPIKSHRRR